jgi:hypothetical protein
LKVATSPAAQNRDASVKLMQEKIPVVPESIDLEDCLKRSNKDLSEIEEIEGKKCRVFNFPTDSSIGYIAPNKAVEKKIKVSTGASKRLDQPAKGKIVWPADQPVSFTGGIQITNFPEIYEHFDDEAIASLTLKGAKRLPAIETLAKWPNLRWLTLQDCELDAKYTKGLNQLKHLQSLTLNQTKTQLDLRSATLPANAMKELSQIKSLFSLSVDRAKYKPESLFDLGTSVSVRKIYVSPDNPTDQMLGRFRKRFPNIKIVRKEIKGL